MKTIDFSYFIERYISGEMDLIEKNWFEKELDGNEKLQQELLLRKRVDNELIQHDRISLRNKLINLEKARKEKLITTSGKKAIVIRFAATIAALITLGSIYHFTAGTKNPDSLYTRNFKVYDLSNNSRTGASGQNLEFSTAYQLYQDMDYEGAAAKFRDYLRNHPQNMEAHLIYGVSEMKNYNYPDAKTAFHSVIDNNDNLFIDMAQWYLALCCIKTGDNIDAKRQLDAIVNSESIFKNRAKKLMKRIK